LGVVNEKWRNTPVEEQEMTVALEVEETPVAV
jgi:hypothetical protein